MSLRVNTTGNVLLRNVGSKGAEAVDTTASVAAKRKFGDTTYSIRATESTIRNIESLNGAVVQLSKPLGALILCPILCTTNSSKNQRTLSKYGPLSGVLALPHLPVH